MNLRKKQEFEPLAVAFKRGMNIVRQAAKAAKMDGNVTVQTELLKEPCEQTLYQVLESAGSEVTQHMEARSYREALESMVPLREPLDGFFNGVMVMAEDPALARQSSGAHASPRRSLSLKSPISPNYKMHNVSG